VTAGRPDRPSVAVVGAGLGGLTAALAMVQEGFGVTVYEQATQLGEVGAGLTLSRGAQHVLASVGLVDELRRHASAVRSNAFLHYRTGALLDGAFDHSEGSVDPDAAPVNLHLHRADLHRVLVDALEARAPGSFLLGHQLVGIEHRADGVRLAFEGRSPVDAGRAAVYYGPDRVLNRYTLRKGTLVNCVAIARTGTWRAEGWSSPATTDELVALYQGWHRDVLGLLRAAPPDGLRKWALYDRDPLARWGSGPVTLVGDAAHPMLPFLGLGAAMAIEDGVVLARCLAADPAVSGLDRYELVRRPRTTEIMLASRQEGSLVQARDPERFDAARAPSRNATFYDFDLDVVAG
jgi:salicylate hydroxylase